jgi:hypothetical protein
MRRERVVPQSCRAVPFRRGKGSVMTSRIRAVLALAVIVPASSCRTVDKASPTAASPITAAAASPAPATSLSGAEAYVTLGFWNDPACSGEPVAQRRMPVHYGDSQCFSWPGRSGTNSATNFVCGADSFAYTQWTTLTCSGGERPEGTRKVSHTTGCTQDFPPTLYSRVLDFSGCR